MKKEVDSGGRIIYKFSHSISKGGNFYAHKTKQNANIKQKDEIKKALNALSLHGST